MNTATNPFKAGVYDGRQTYHCTAEDRVLVVQYLDRADCEAALKVKGLQKTVEAAVHRRLRHLAKVATTIRFEDHGQDFLEWDLDAAGKIIECRPLQGWPWCGRRVVNHKSLCKGVYPILADMTTVKYRPADVQRFEVAKP